MKTGDFCCSHYATMQAQWRLRDCFGRITVLCQVLGIPSNAGVYHPGSDELLFDFLAAIINLDRSSDERTSQPQLARLIGRIKNPTVRIIPLVLVTDEHKPMINVEESLVIKSLKADGKPRYLDMNGRSYPSMNRFLHHNQLPEGILVYSEGKEVLVEDDRGGLKLKFFRVGKHAFFVGIADGIVAALNCMASGGLLLIGPHPVFEPAFRLTLGISNLYLATRATSILFDLLRHGGIRTIHLKILNCALVIISLVSLVFACLQPGPNIFGMTQTAGRITLGLCLSTVLLWVLFQKP
ncbi:uncharacterized protein LOC129742217 isoform X2 [Uranotaenia lowii]|uniref:uncharacterized protein LOC129742217 isoform X2 n=1 Tax=Uranotaenia lowii TaxID=190385 RepID=UPI00247B2134|nr:uncharacterized protein LOC129742217 isoform X2 [Uranotaenia lowii]